MISAMNSWDIVELLTINNMAGLRIKEAEKRLVGQPISQFSALNEFIHVTYSPSKDTLVLVCINF